MEIYLHQLQIASWCPENSEIKETQNAGQDAELSARGQFETIKTTVGVTMLLGLIGAT
jgi:hypothetical protein